MLANTSNSEYAKVRPLDFGQVRWTGGFWSDVTDVCANHMVPQLRHMFEAKDISHVVENFRICAGESEGGFDGTVFGDGDFYKWMESELYSAAILKDEERFQRLEKYVDLIGKAQQEDGYISTKQIIEERLGIGVGRMKDINAFEVYNMGHLFTSACLYKRITGKDHFLKIAEKAADYLKMMYEAAEKSGNVQTAVCPSHYMGLIELYRTTGEEKYLELAKKAIELRDMVKNGMDDNQDRVPLKQHEKIIGHAVRATYLYAGVSDLYLETGDEEYFSMLHKVWKNMVNTKLYLTGGIGALYNGTSPYGNFFTDQKIHQAFGYEYQLPNITAYNETCASIGLVMWAYRMFLAEQKAEYFDVLERAMLNVNLAAVSLDGKKYFYENMLRRAAKLEYELIWPLTRSEYILSYCCPPNLARAIMQSSEYAYTVSEDSVYFGLYGESQAQIRLKNGAEFTIEQKTEYPYDGRIELTFSDIKADMPVTLKLRIPHWTENGFVQNGDSKICLSKRDSGTYKDVFVEKLEGTVVILHLDMPVRYTISHPMVEENVHQAAVERGPLVYCIESEDCMLETLDELYLDQNTEFQLQDFEICGRKMKVISGAAYRVSQEGYEKNALYQTLRMQKKEKTEIRLIPYFAWDNREMGEMRIWVPYI